MTDIMLLITSAAWRKLKRLCADASQWKTTTQGYAQLHAINYLSLAPYSTADVSHHVEAVAKQDAIAACSLCLYRASLLFTYKHIINKDYQRAHEECTHAIVYLHESLNRLDIKSELMRNEQNTRARCFVNSLASQAELQAARINNKVASHLVFILGMHRSGTSALTGMLAQAGFAVPSDLMPATDANPKGYWESVGIMGLNEGFLARMESHWSSVLPLPAGWSASINGREWRTSLINIISESFGGAELPTIKDPRFCTLISGLEPWFESRLIDISFIIPIRHPLEVSNSLQQAEGIELNKALSLWIKSVFGTENATRGYNRKFIGFDGLMENPINALESCIQLVETDINPETTTNISKYKYTTSLEALSHASEFIDKSLKRQRAEISKKDTQGVGYKQNAKLLELSERAYLAVLANIKDDNGISEALDELWPSISLISL
jgi:hypothetical protein